MMSIIMIKLPLALFFLLSSHLQVVVSSISILLIHLHTQSQMEAQDLLSEFKEVTTIFGLGNPYGSFRRGKTSRVPVETGSEARFPATSTEKSAQGGPRET